MAQSRERSPPTNVVRDRCRSGSRCGSSLLLVLAQLQGPFSGFSVVPPPQNQYLQIPTRLGPVQNPANTKVVI